MLVQDDDIGAQPLQAPVLLRLQHLAHERHVVVADDAHEQDRQIAGNAVRPEAGLAELVRRERVRRGARSEPSANSTRDARRSNSSASSLEIPRWRSPLCACVKASANARERRARVAVLLRERLRPSRGPRRCRWRNERRTDAPGTSLIALAEAEDRVEHDAGRARQRAAVERRRALGVAAAAEEPRAIGFPLDRSLRPALEAQDVHGPDGRSRRIARRGDGRAARRCRAGTRSRETACRTPDARDRRPAAPARSRRSW